MREVTYAEAIREALREEMLRDERVFILGEDVGVYGGAFGVTRGLVEEFGEERVRDTPISEGAIAGAATGAAVTGMRPVAEIMFMDFTLISMDQLVNQTAKIRYMFGGKASVPMVLRTPMGSGTGAAAQHSQSLEGLFCHIPGIKVVCPSTATDAKGLLKSAIRDDNPVLFVEHKLLYKQKFAMAQDDPQIPLGQAEVKRAGRDLTIVSWSNMVHRALEASEILAKEGIEAEVVDLRTLVPLDVDTLLASVRKTGRVLIVHEAVERAGFGAEVAAVIAASDAFDYLDAPIARRGGVACPIPYSPSLERAAVPQVADVVEEARRLLCGG